MPGSISKLNKKDKHGREMWLLQICVGTRPDGKPAKYARNFHGTRANAQKELAKFYAEKLGAVADAAAPPGQTITLAAYADRYLARVRAVMSRTTIHAKETHLSRRILPALGSLKLADIKPIHVKSFMAALAEETKQYPGNKKDRPPEKLSPATQLKIYTILSTILQEAVYDEIIDVNPCTAVRRPQNVRKPVRYIQGDDIAQWLTAINKESPRQRAMYLVLLSLGLRRGELAALKWSAINWQQQTLTVSASIDYIPGKGESEKTPKSAAGIRTLSIPNTALDALKVWQGQQTDHNVDVNKMVSDDHFADVGKMASDNYIFTGDDGKRLHIEYINTTYRRFLTRHKLPDVTLHGLRHTAITMWLQNGMPLAGAAQLSGHASQTTTAGMYSHAYDTNRLQAAQIMEEKLKSNK